MPPQAAHARGVPPAVCGVTNVHCCSYCASRRADCSLISQNSPYSASPSRSLMSLLVRQPPAAPAPQALSPEPAPVPELTIVSSLRAKCSCINWATRSVPMRLSSEVAGSHYRQRASGSCRVGAEHGLRQCLCLLPLEWPWLLTCVVALSPLGWSPEIEIDEAGDGSQLQPVGR